MILESLSQLNGLFGRRFFFNALLPTMVFTSLVLLLAGFSLELLPEWSSSWERAGTLSKIVTIGAYLAVIWFLSTAIATQWRNIVRFFEGYPLIRVFGSRTPGVAWHKERQRLLWGGDEKGGVDPDPDELYLKYPLPDEDDDSDIILPTRLGNVLLSAERYSLSRYGMDMIYFWTRLFPLLPDSFKKDMDEYLLDYEFPLVVAFQAASAGCIGAVLILIGGQAPALFILWLGTLMLVAYAFYLLGIGNAEELAEQQRVAFDLYRHLLLESWPTPLDVRDERAAFVEIQDFIVANFEPSWGVAQEQHRLRLTRRHLSS